MTGFLEIPTENYSFCGIDIGPHTPGNTEIHALILVTGTMAEKRPACSAFSTSGGIPSSPTNQGKIHIVFSVKHRKGSSRWEGSHIYPLGMSSVRIKGLRPGLGLQWES